MPGTDRLDFREALARGPILLDAAMGTRLIARGLDLALEDPSTWVLDHPEAILEVHRLDAEAGAEGLLTDTFGANRAWLARIDRAEDAPRINRRAVELAREAGGPSTYLLGSIGPTASDRPDAFLEQVEALEGAGVDAIFLETHRLDQAEAALRLLQGRPTPVLASLHDWPEPIDRSAGRLIDLGAMAIGANCQAGMLPALDLARKLRDIGNHPLVLKPSAARPGSAPESPESFALAIPELIDLGVRLVGGCCGSTEAHVEAMKLAIVRDRTRA